MVLTIYYQKKNIFVILNYDLKTRQKEETKLSASNCTRKSIYYVLLELSHLTSKNLSEMVDGESIHRLKGAKPWSMFIYKCCNYKICTFHKAKME